MNRRYSREVAMKLLFQMGINKEEVDTTVNEYLNLNVKESKGLDIDYVNRVLEGVEKNKEEIDSSIQEKLVKWKLDRISKVDLAILRECVYEILFEDDIPTKVSVNEAIELSKKYSVESSTKFINGVLGNFF
ncbi:MAG: transcription antitermination factor NusB [Clostridiaceae bacterium]